MSNSSTSVKEEKNHKRINNNLDNYTIGRACEDRETFRIAKKPVYAISYYRAESGENNPKQVKKMGGKDFYLQSYTEYLQDGRKRYKEYIYDHTRRIENYHYDEKFDNLLLLHRVEPNAENERNYYNILNYYPDKLLKEEIEYRTYKGNDFDVQGFTGYKAEKNKSSLTIRINDIGYDSIPAPQEIYTFTGDALIKEKPLYQSKKQYFEWMVSRYVPVKTEDYVVKGRNIAFTYDTKGFITSETWMEDGQPVYTKEFEYNAGHTECIEQQYGQQGKEKSTKYIRKYNKQGDLFFEQTVEYNGNKLAPIVTEYVYDQYDNWTERKKYRLSAEEDGDKIPVQHEIREITYFENDSKVRELPFPKLSGKVQRVAATLPKSAGKKQKSINAFDQAVEKGKYDTKITKTGAKDIKDFTPKFWKLKATAFGDLDKLPGDEAVAVYETPIPADVGFEQVLAIFKKKHDKWMLWHQSAGPLLDTQGGGTMGNPFEGIAIANRAIVVNHFGGSREKWSYKHIYRFQNNDWYLIGASVHFGAPCDYFVDFDYNLSTGDVVAEYQQEICNDEGKGSEKHWKERFKQKTILPKMDEFIPGNNKVDVPDLDYEVYY
ncbi:hypothetical protein [Pararcticibacter amylolyticus]|nr:hypothetical protein [Pararcticibacter amylolyticus]